MWKPIDSFLSLFLAVRLDTHLTLKCDRPGCHHQEQVERKKLHEYVDACCPICGDNILTKRSYKSFKTLQRSAVITNIVFFPIAFPVKLWAALRGDRGFKVIKKISVGGDPDGKLNFREG